MSDSGVFRSAIGGFHKQDVLRYIDELQAAHMQELEQLEGQLAAVRTELEETKTANQALEQSEAATAATAEQKAAEWDAESAQLQRLIDEQNSANRMLRSQVQETREELEKLRSEHVPLKEQLEAAKREAASLKSRLEEAAAHEAAYARQQAAIADLKKRLSETETASRQADRRLREAETANSRYAQLIGDVGSFIMEIRSMGQHVLNGAHVRGTEALAAVSGAVTLLQQQMADAALQLETAEQELARDNHGAEQRLEELAQSLSRSADAIQSEAEPAVKDAPAPSDFFR